MSEEIITGIDLGSSHIRIAVGKIDEAHGGTLQILAAVEEPSDGISKGAITSIENAVSSVSRCLEKAERAAGLPIERVFVSLTEPHVIAETARGIIGVSRSDGEIRPEDVERVIEAAKTTRMPTNYQILHVLPKTFVVDSQTGVKDPIGMMGIRLEVDAMVVQALASNLKNVSRCVYRTGIEINDIVIGTLASALAVLTSRQKELGAVVINIGASTTGVAVFEEGEVLHLAIIPIGSEHITNDLAIGLRTSIEVAERIKRQAGSAVPETVNKREEIDLKEFGASSSEIVSKRFIADVIHARVEEIFEKVAFELKKIKRDGMLPAGVILTGGGAKLSGIIDAAKRTLRLPAAEGTVLSIVSNEGEALDPTFSTAVGLVKWGMESYMENGNEQSFFSKIAKISKITEMFKKLFKGMLP